MTRSSRRTFLAGAGALSGMGFLPRLASADTALSILRAAPSTAQLAPAGYPATPVWAYATEGASVIPGPEIRVTAGERVRHLLVNDLPQPTAVHWHGVRIENAMDGAAPLTQAPVAPGEEFGYDFVAPDPGTYWYHSHNRSWEQVARGLAGPLIVQDREAWMGEPGAATHERTLVLDDWLLDQNASLIDGNWDSLHTASHGGRMGNLLTVNGKVRPNLIFRGGERVRLRLINAATARIMTLGLPGLSAHVIALDGHPVEPRAVESFVIAPAQRADVVIDIPQDMSVSAGLLFDTGRDGWVLLAGIQTRGEQVAPQLDPVRALPAWGSLRNPQSTDVQREEVIMEGGAMRGLGDTMFNGRKMEASELARNGMVWAFNGSANETSRPVFTAARGRTVQLALVNRTAFPHAIHLHGHHFKVLTRNGASDPYQDVRDTVLADAGETVEIAFVADNPGQWMLHCHMLSHAASGMMSWFEVA